VLLAEVLLSQSYHMLCWFWRVANCWIHVYQVDDSLAVETFSDGRCDFGDSCFHHFKRGVVVGSDGSFHDGFIWENVEGMPSGEIADREDDVLSAVNVSRLYGIESLMNHGSGCDWIS